MESNHYSHFRRMLSYPLNESGKILAPGLGIEPRLTESKSVVLPLHNPGIIKQDTFFTKGLEPFAQPLSESAIRQMLESNQRVINDFAVRILNLVSLPGFEPGSLP